MDIDGTMLRQAVNNWRDEYTVHALNLLNDCARRSRQDFDAHLEEAGLLDSVWDPAGFADARVDRLMWESITKDVPELMARAGKALSSLSDAFAVIGDALSTGEPLDMPTLNEPTVAPSQVTQDASEKLASATSDGSWTGFGVSLLRRAAEVGGRAVDTIREAGTLAERNLQQRTGLDDRLRAAAMQRIATTWMGTDQNPPSVLTQLLSRLDEAAFNARMTTL